jgi:hypothetical protein
MNARLSIALLGCLVSTVASAQPMMVDPSRMSGIPRPDSQVPAGTVTVRLIRGELSNRVTDHEVVLEDGSGNVKKAKTDDQGRATFSGLSGGPFRARAADEGVELASQPIELPGAMGVRVMLVFPAAGGADGVGRPDKSVPAGTVIVKAEDGEGKPIAGLDVILGHARAGEQGVRELKGKTDDKGEAKFDGLDAKPTSGYLAEVVKDGQRYAGKPFRMSENMGARVSLSVRPVSKDLGTLSFGPESRLIFEVQDDAVQVIEILYLENPGSSPVDPGPGGLHIPLPDKAASGIVGPQSPPNLSVSGHEAVWKGAIPPGETAISMMYLLAFDKGTLPFRQATPVPFAQVNIITEKLEGFTIEGRGLTGEDREMNGHKVVVYRGSPSPANGLIELELTGLPHPNPLWALLAAGVSVAILIGFIGWGLRGPRAGASQREKLEDRREQLMAELAKLDAASDGDDGKRKKKRDELVDKLARLYKELDEVA